MQGQGSRHVYNVAATHNAAHHLLWPMRPCAELNSQFKAVAVLDCAVLCGCAVSNCYLQCLHNGES